MVNLETEFKNLGQLYRAYMPFIKNGGLFFSSTQEFALGETVSVRFRLPDNDEWHSYEGLVVWCNPLGSQGGRPPGVGVAFQDTKRPYKDIIERLLAAMLGSNQLTSTM